MKAKKPIEQLNASDLGVDTSPRIEQIKVEEPPKRKAGTKVSSVAELVQKLKMRQNINVSFINCRTYNKELRPFTLNVVTAASQIDTDVHTIVIGQNCDGAAKGYQNYL